MGRILVIAAVLILYGSLYPFDFHSRVLTDGPLWTVLHAWPGRLDRSLLGDAVLNVLIYIPIGTFGSLWLGKGKPRVVSGACVVFVAFLLSLAIETVQLYDAARTASALDVTTNTAGAALGVWLAFLYGETLVRIWARPELRASFRPSAALLLLCCWIGSQTFPLIPRLGLFQAKVKLAAFWHTPSAYPVEAIGALIDWLAVARLIELATAASGRRWLLPVFLLLLPARLLIVGRGLAWPELLGAVCAWAIWRLWLRRRTQRGLLLAWAASAMLLVRGLAPFRWRATASPFIWSPFIAMIDTGLLSGMVFFNKTFLYGTAIRLCADAGCSYAMATALVAGVLGAIEFLQIHLPGRTPEITDPLYAVILGVVLQLLDSADRQGARRPT